MSQQDLFAVEDQLRKIPGWHISESQHNASSLFAIRQWISSCLKNAVRVVWPLFFGLELMGFSLPLWALTVDTAAGPMEISEAQKAQARKDADEFSRLFGSKNDSVTREKTALLLLMNVRLRSVEEPQGQSHILAMLAAYDEIDHRFGRDSNPVIRAIIVEALARKGTLIWEKHGYWKEGDPQWAIAVFDEIGRRFGDDKNPDVYAMVVRALFAKAVVMKKLAGDKVIYDEADRQFEKIDFSKILNTLDHWFGRDGYPDTRSDAVAFFYRRIATHFFTDGIISRSRADCEKAIFAFDEMDRRFGKVFHEFLGDKIFDGMFQKSFCFAEQGKFEEAIAGYDEIIKRLTLWSEVIGSEFQPIKDGYVAKALSYKERIIEKHGRKMLLK
jgi:hypothetical protein